MSYATLLSGMLLCSLLPPCYMLLASAHALHQEQTPIKFQQQPHCQLINKTCATNVLTACLHAAAPLMMTGVQFAIQNLLARFVIKVGIVQRTAAAVELDWRQYMQQGDS